MDAYGWIHLSTAQWALVLALLNHAIREMPLVEPLARPVRDVLCAELGIEGEGA
jgi:hypothetical protein